MVHSNVTIATRCKKNTRNYLFRFIQNLKCIRTLKNPKQLRARITSQFSVNPLEFHYKKILKKVFKLRYHFQLCYSSKLLAVKRTNPAKYLAEYLGHFKLQRKDGDTFFICGPYYMYGSYSFYMAFEVYFSFFSFWGYCP